MGLIATARKSPCLLICYSFFLLLAFMILVAGIACSIRIIFVVYMDIDRTLALPLLKRYGFDSYATSTWDTLQGNDLTDMDHDMVGGHFSHDDTYPPTQNLTVAAAPTLPSTSDTTRGKTTSSWPKPTPCPTAAVSTRTRTASSRGTDVANPSSRGTTPSTWPATSPGSTCTDA